MKSHKGIEIIASAIFSSTSGFAPGETASIFVLFFVFSTKTHNFRLSCVLATAEKMIGSEQTLKFLNPFVYSFLNVQKKAYATRPHSNMGSL